MDSKQSSGGIGLGGATFLVFLILKLCGVINWSWWWVTAPLWGAIVLVLAIMAGAIVVAGVLFFLAWVVTKFCK